MTLNQALIDDVQQVLDGKGFLVGGSVRDHAMNRQCDDFDFATPLSPDEVVERVRAAGKRAFLTGQRFGTIGFKSHGEKVEVTTFRAETYASGNRKPEVSFVQDLHADLARRDFTFNAMAIDADGKLIDPFSGLAAIEAMEVRSVGDANDRFVDDPLRIVRAARFSSQLGFTISNSTTDAMEANAALIHNVARERWVQEFDKLLMGKGVNPALAELLETNVLRFMFPEFGLNGPQFINANTLDERWRQLLHSAVDTFGLTDDQSEAVRKVVAEGMALRLKFSNDRRKAVTA